MSSNGLQGVGQKELVFVIECLPEENSLPKDVFNLYVSIYQDAQKGMYNVTQRLYLICSFCYCVNTRVILVLLRPSLHEHGYF